MPKKSVSVYSEDRRPRETTHQFLARSWLLGAVAGDIAEFIRYLPEDAPIDNTLYDDFVVYVAGKAGLVTYGDGR